VPGRTSPDDGSGTTPAPPAAHERTALNPRPRHSDGLPGTLTSAPSAPTPPPPTPASAGPAVAARRVVVAVADGTGVAVWLREPPEAGSGAEGVPMLLVHGLASVGRLWDGVADELVRRGHPVAAVDQRGHGASDKPDEGYDFATLTDDLVAVLDALHWSEPVVAAGQSWGANVVLELAARQPHRLRAAALVDGGTIELSARFADWPTAEAALAPPQLEGTPLAEMERMLRARHPDWPETGIAGALATMEVLPDATVRPWLSREHHLRILRGLWEHHPPQRYPDVGVPVLVIPAGDPSRPASRFETAKREEVAAAAAGLGTVAVRWIDGDHDLHAQFPGRIAELLSAAADGSVFATP